MGTGVLVGGRSTTEVGVFVGSTGVLVGVAVGSGLASSSDAGVGVAPPSRGVSGRISGGTPAGPITKVAVGVGELVGTGVGDGAGVAVSVGGNVGSGAAMATETGIGCAWSVSQRAWAS